MQLRSIVGIRPIIADVVVATVGNARPQAGSAEDSVAETAANATFQRWHARLGQIKRPGGGYLRTLLIQGACGGPQRAKSA